MLRRVLHIHTLPVISGSGLNTLASIRRLREHGFQAELACGSRMASGISAGSADGCSDSLTNLARTHGIPVHEIPHLTRTGSLRQDALALLEIAAIIRRGGYEVVHTHNSKAGLLGRLAARAIGVPAVVHTVHGWAFEQAGNALARVIYRTIERGAARLAHHTILVSAALEASAVRAGLAGCEKRQVVYSGIDRAAFFAARRSRTLRRSLGATEKTFLVGQVAKLWKGKGHDTLLAAFARLRRTRPNARLVLVGDGPLRSAIARQASCLGIEDHLFFTGHREDIAAITAQLDVATLCSGYEGMGRVVVEAMAAGTPVVASRVGGITELIEEGRTGYLVPPGDDIGLADRLGRLAGDRSLRRRMGRCARLCVDERFDEGAMAADIAAIYRDLIARADMQRTGQSLRSAPIGHESCT